jgi:hypothetical protein
LNFSSMSVNQTAAQNVLQSIKSLHGEIGTVFSGQPCC